MLRRLQGKDDEARVGLKIIHLLKDIHLSEVINEDFACNVESARKDFT